MNYIVLHGYLRDIEFSHCVNNIEYEKAHLICDDDIISVKYKKFNNKYKEGELVDLKGNVRTFSRKHGDRNSVETYVFTYFDLPDELIDNKVIVDGRVCKIDAIRKDNGIACLNFILANNIFTNSGKKINNYIPVSCYGNLAEQLSGLKVNDVIELTGKLKSHTYKKYYENDMEIKVAHSVIADCVEFKERII